MACCHHHGIKVKVTSGNTKGWSIIVPLAPLFDWFGISCMTTDKFCFYLQNRLIQACQTGGQWYSDTSPFCIPWWHDRISRNDNVNPPGRIKSLPTLISVYPGSAVTNGREPKSCLGQVFNSKLGRIAALLSKCWARMLQPLLELKTRPRARPVS